MILYNVTVNIDNSVAEEWLEWMRKEHIPEVMATGFFLKNQIARVLGDDESGGMTYAIQYTVRNMDDLLEYSREHAPALQAKHTERYKNQFVSFRTLLEVVE